MASGDTFFFDEVVRLFNEQLYPDVITLVSLASSLLDAM